MECERTNPTDPLRQGDIIAAHPQTANWQNPWARYRVVLSADCDLAMGKTGPDGLVVVPIVAHQTYLTDIWLPEEAAKCAKKATDLVNRQLQGFPARVTRERLEKWGMQGGGKHIEAQLTQLLDPALLQEDTKAAAKVIGLQWDALAQLRESATPSQEGKGDIREQVLRHYEHRHMLEPIKGDLRVFARNKIHDALQATLDRLDTCLIASMIGLDPEMMDATGFGFIVVLRKFSVIPVGCIEIDRSSWYNSRNSYLRICRLRGIYKADLVQKFANMFVRVGLEDYRIEEHRRSMKRCAEHVFPEEK